MSNVYISGHDKARALSLKEKLSAAGHAVVSTWHDGDCKRTKDRDERDLRVGADRNFTQIEEEADMLVADYGPNACGGIDVEVGAAIALGVPVLALGAVREDGARRNNLLYHPAFKPTTDEALVTDVEELDDVDEEDELDDFDDEDEILGDDDEDFEDEDDDEDF